MLKVAVARCAFILLTLSMLAASGADKTVTNEEDGFTITYPEKWDVVDGDDGKAPLAAQEKQRAGALVRVSDATGLTLKTFLANLVAKEKGLNIAEKVETKFAGVDAYKVTILWTKDATQFKTVSYLFVKGTHGYAVSTMAQKDTFDNYAKEFDAIVKSFKLIEAK